MRAANNEARPNGGAGRRPDPEAGGRPAIDRRPWLALAACLAVAAGMAAGPEGRARTMGQTPPGLYPVARDVPPYRPLSPRHARPRPGRLARCMAAQRGQGFHAPDAWEHARRSCARATPSRRG